ncbi:glutathione S-transferase family protein [Bdellovibrio bacteriovorus W]|nr:glutathione S-transferase family protein [Bdellovibrio bacteriovorus W]
MIDFYTAATPNGQKVSLMLHELGVEFKEHKVNLAANEQKTPEFLKMNPNGRIPVIVDHEGPFGKKQTVFESGAILYYLAEKYGRFFGNNLSEKAVAMEWVMFQMAGIGPMFGNLYYGKNSLKPFNPAYVARFHKESARLISVMEMRLRETTYLAGHAYTIADMTTYPWIRAMGGMSPELLNEAPAVRRWMAAIADRPAVKKALA